MLSYFIRPTLYFLCIGLLNAYPLAATKQYDEKEQKPTKFSFYAVLFLLSTLKSYGSSMSYDEA